MEKNKSFSNQFLSEEELSNLCDRFLVLLGSSNRSIVISQSKTLLKSLLSISNQSIAEKAFLILLEISEHFYINRDLEKSRKYLSGANSLISLVSSRELLSNFKKLRSLITSSNKQSEMSIISDIKIFTDYQESSSKVNSKYSSSKSSYDFESIIEKRNLENKKKRPSTASRDKPKAFNSHIPQSYRTLKSSSRPSSAKYGTEKKHKISPITKYFSLPEGQNEKPVKPYKKKRFSVGLSQCVQVFTPPKTPEGLVNINILNNASPPPKLPDYSSSLKKKDINFSESFSHKPLVNPRNPLNNTAKIKIRTDPLNDTKKIAPSRPVKIEKNEVKLAKEEIEFLPKKEKICKILKVRLSEDYLKKVIKIQAFYRGRLARENFSLLKKKKDLARCDFVIIKSSLMKIKIFKDGLAFRANAFDGENCYSLVLSSSEFSSYNKRQFYMKNGRFAYNSEKFLPQNEFAYLLDLDSIISNKKIPVRYSRNLNKLIIRADLIYENKAYSVQVKYSDKLSLEYQINHNINNYLEIKNDELQVDYPVDPNRKKLLYKIKCKHNNEFYFITFYETVINEIPKIEGCVINTSKAKKSIFFIIKKEFDQFFKESIFSQNNAFIYFLALDLSKPGFLKDKISFRILGSIKKPIFGKDHKIRCFVNYSERNKYIFECIGLDEEIYTSIQLSKNELNKVIKVKSKDIEDSIEKILNLFTIKNSELTPVYMERVERKSLEVSLNQTRVILSLQRKFRLRFNRNKKELDSSNSLIYTQAKSIKDKIYSFKVYKIINSFLIEGFEKNSKKLIFKFIENPLEYISSLNKIADLRKLIDAIYIFKENIVISRIRLKLLSEDPELSFFIDTNLTEEEDQPDGWPIFSKKELNGIQYLMKATLDKEKSLKIDLIPFKKDFQELSRKFTQKEIVKQIGLFDPISFIPILRVSDGVIVTSDLVRHSIPVEGSEFLSVHFINKFCIQSQDHLYIVCVTFSEDPNFYEESELKFYARMNSSLERCRKITIKLGQASVLTGLDPKGVIAMSEYIGKNMIVVNVDEFYIDCSLPPVLKERYIAKLQALIRGFRCRMKYNVKLYFIFKESVKIHSSSFTVLIYMMNSEYYLASVKGFNVFKGKLPEDVIRKFYLADNKKAFIFDEVVKNLKKSDKRFSFLNEGIAPTIRRRPTLELAQASVVPSLVNLIRDNAKRGDECELIYSSAVSQNYVDYEARIIKKEGRYFMQVKNKEEIITNGIEKDIKDFQSYLRNIHVDFDKKDFILEEENISDKVMFIDGVKVNIIIFQSGNLVYLDGVVLASKKQTIIQIGDKNKINSTLRRLKVVSNKLVLSSYS